MAAWSKATDQAHGHGRPVQRRKAGRVHPANQPRESLEAARWATSSPASKELQAAKGGRHRDRGEKRQWRWAFRHRPLPGFKEIQPQVFAGLYPTEASEYDSLRDALEKLKLNDASLALRTRSVAGAGFGFSMRFPGPLCTWRSCKSAWSVSLTRT